MADTGNGTTMTFGTSGYSLAFTEIDAGEATREPIEDTKLSTTGNMEFIPGDLEDSGEISGVYQWDQSYGTFPATTSAPETITITYPLKSGESTNATLAGSGMVTRIKRPVSRNGELMMGEITVKWDGKTGPTFTAGSA